MPPAAPRSNARREIPVSLRSMLPTRAAYGFWAGRGVSNVRAMPASNSGNRFAKTVLTVTRVWLPVGIAVAGLAGIGIGQAKTSSPWAAAGVSLLLVAVIVWMINWMFRIGVESNREREREEQAREYFSEHGRWPGE